MQADEILEGTLDVEWDAVENSENGSPERKQAVDNVNKLYQTAANVQHQIWQENFEEKKLDFEKEKHEDEKSEREAKKEEEKKEKKRSTIEKIIGWILQLLAIIVPAGLLGANLYVQHKQAMHDVIPDSEMKTAEKLTEQFGMKGPTRIK